MKCILYNGLLLMLALTLGISSSLQSAHALAEIKASAVVNSPAVTLGDLFDNLDQGHDIWVANAPAPGDKATISTRYLANLTRQHNVYWQNSQGLQQVSISRRGLKVKFTDLKHLIAQELETLSLGDRKGGIRFNNRNGALNLPEDSSVEDVSVQEFNFDRKSNKFSAILSYPTGQNSSALTTVRGHTFAASYVPVLNKNILPGDPITAQDISWHSIPARRIGRNIIRDKNQLLGMTPRRVLTPEAPLSLSDLKRPQIIDRGKIVTMLYQAGKITLTATGKAIKAGGQGDMIHVMNLKSHKTVEAIITGPNQVQVITAHTDLAHLNLRP